MIYIIRILSNMVIYYLLLHYLSTKYKYRKSKIFINVTYFVGIILISFINIYNIPMINLLSSFVLYNLLSYLLFCYHDVKEYFKDIMFYLILVFADSICFFITGIIYDGLGIKMLIFRSLASSVILIFISIFANKTILQTKIKNIPYTEILIFFIITFFNLILILLLSVEYDYISNYFGEMFISFIVVGIVFIDLVIIHYLDYINKNYEMKNELILEQKHADLVYQHYQDLKFSYEETRKLIHDFRNHFQIICSAYASGNDLLAKQTIEQFNLAYEKVKIKYKTGSDILDILLNEKYKIACNAKIQFAFNQQFIDLSFISDFDMITIFGNLLDNAIEANDFQDCNLSKFINLKIYKIQEMIVLNLTNSCNNTISYEKDKLVSSKNKKRGFGLINVKKTIEKYDGNFSIKIENYECNIIISIPYSN